MAASRDAKRWTSGHIIGSIPDIPVGTIFQTRLELRDSGIHRTIESGIFATKEDGAYSIVLNGAYEDDKDAGDTIYYTGEGKGKDAEGHSKKNPIRRPRLGFAGECWPPHGLQPSEPRPREQGI